MATKPKFINRSDTGIGADRPNIPVSYSPIEPRLDQLAAQAARLCDAPIGLIAVKEADGLRLKGRHDSTNTACTHDGLIHYGQQYVCNGPFEIDRPTDDADALGPAPSSRTLGAIFCAGVPLTGEHQQVLGILMVADHVSRSLTPEHFRHLEHIATAAVAVIGSATAQQQKVRLERILDDIADEVFIAHYASGKIIYSNASAQSHLGYSESQLKRRTILQLNVSPTPGMLRRTMLSLFRGNIKVASFGAYHQRADGSLYPVSVHLRRYGAGNDPSILITATTHNTLGDTGKSTVDHDILTGLFTHSAMEKHLKLALDQRRGNQTHALLYLDLDRLKLINDTFGHTAGDHVLREVAKILQQHTGKNDVIARLTSDEFAALFNNCSMDDALNTTHKIIEAVNQLVFTWEGHTVSVTASAGIVEIDKDGSNVSDWLNMADSACCAAKERGRSRIQVYQAEDKHVTRRKDEMAWAGRLNTALAEDRMVVCYQPIVKLSSTNGPDTMYEVLVRMIGEKGQIVPPDAFIPAAEHYNLMPTVDRWVVSRVFKSINDCLRDHGDISDSHPVFTVNVSGTTLSNVDFVDFVERRFKEYNIPRGVIYFEITETAAISNMERAVAFIDSMRALGCGIMLDDFGTGVSSFGYLRTLKVDYIKIDGSFVRNIHNDPINYALVEAIHRLGRLMGLSSVAEFVENRAALDAVRAIGIDYAQGVGVSVPGDRAWRPAGLDACTIGQGGLGINETN